MITLKLDYINKTRQEKQSMLITNDKIYETVLFKDFNTLVPLLYLNVSLQDADLIILGGTLNLSINNIKRSFSFSSLNITKFKVKNEQQEINNTVYEYKIRAIGISIEKSKQFLKKHSGNLKDINILNDYFDNINSNIYNLYNFNYFNSNILQIINKINYNIYYEKDNFFNTPISIINDDLSTISFNDFFKLNSNQFYLDNSFTDIDIESINIYKYLNLNDNETNNNSFMQYDTHLENVNVDYKNKQLNDMYYKNKKDIYLKSSNLPLLDGINKENLLNIYENSKSIPISLMSNNMFKNIQLGNDILYNNKKERITSFQFSTNNNSELIGCVLQTLEL